MLEAGASGMTSESGETAGGDTGRVDSQGGQSQGGAAAVGGGGGETLMDEGGAPSVVTPDDMGEACSDNGTLRCVAPAQKVSQICDAGKWTTATICKSDENCDQTTGSCAPIVADCAGKIGGQLYCGPDDKIFACGPDLVSTAETEACTGKCTDSEASASCAPVTCGDGKVQAPEACDDGNQTQTDACTNACKKATCGDGSIWKDHEACDDGNAMNDDACSATCNVSTCGDGYVWIGKETCDDKNKVDTDACTNACKKAACGDGIVQSGKEECDDKNTTSGDGCSKTCTVEPVQIVALDYRLCALGGNGKIRCFAMGAEDWTWEVVKLDSAERAVAIAAGDLTLCAIMDTGSVRCWGSNHSGKLGAGGPGDRALNEPAPNIELGTDEVATSIAVGRRHVCAVVRNGKVKCWGSNSTGQLGHPENPPDEAVGDEPGEMGQNLIVVPETAVRKATTVMAGYGYTCIRREDQTMRCWGDPAPGSHTAGLEMNLGSVLTVSQGAVGDSHACALLTNQKLKCWRGNGVGQLGQDDVLERNSEGTMGDKLLPIKLGTGRTATYVAAAGSHTCAILDDGSLKCWGNNAGAQLGKGDNVNVGGKPGDMAALLPVDLGVGRTAKQLAFGSTTFCALLTDGRVTCWGGVNTPDPVGLGDQPGEMGDQLPIVPLKF